MKKLATIVIVLSALVALPASATPKKMTKVQLDKVVAGHVSNCGGDFVCGNNGWGNGMDPINPGSYDGATMPSKSINNTNGGGINENPTNSTGR